MDYSFSLSRCLLFACFVAVLWLVGGLSAFGLTGLLQIDVVRSHSALPKFLALYFAGAVSASFVDHTVGYMPPSSLRPVYVVGGLIMMGLALMFILSFRR